jgi:outer membrane protein OmpA-like peptidoglycan-associated protein
MSVFAAGWGCATTRPPTAQLQQARKAYLAAESGPAKELNPADLHDARILLNRAEKAAEDNPTSTEAIHRAYLAERRAELADAQGRLSASQKEQLRANAQLQALKDASKDRAIAKTQAALAEAGAAKREAESQRDAEREARLNGEKEAQAQFEAERAARMAAEQNAREAVASLNQIAAVKEDARGTVITLSGSVLFASGKSMLLPSAQRSLDQVAAALRESDRSVLIEGHTDARGSAPLNEALSQARALSVLEYLASRDVPRERMRAQGLGPNRPVEDNRTAEGRANNRRVEIVLERSTSASLSH